MSDGLRDLVMKAMGTTTRLTLDDIGVVVRFGPVAASVSGSHLLVHRKRRIRKKARRRLEPAIRLAFVHATMAALCEAAA